MDTDTHEWDYDICACESVSIFIDLRGTQVLFFMIMLVSPQSVLLH